MLPFRVGGGGSLKKFSHLLQNGLSRERTLGYKQGLAVIMKIGPYPAISSYIQQYPATTGGRKLNKKKASRQGNESGLQKYSQLQCTEHLTSLADTKGRRLPQIRIQNPENCGFGVGFCAIFETPKARLLRGFLAPFWKNSGKTLQIPNAIVQTGPKHCQFDHTRPYPAIPGANA